MSAKKFYAGGFLVALVAIVAIGFNSIFQFVENDEYVIHQNAFTGSISVWNEPGWRVKMFGKVVRFKKAMDLYLSADKLDGGAGHSVQPVDVVFPDGKASVDVVARYELSLIDSIQKDLYTKYTSPAAIHSMIRQQVIEAVQGVGPLMSSADAYSDRKPEVARLSRNMALNGIYAAQVSVDTTYDTDSNTVLVNKYSVQMKDDIPVITKESVLSQYNITLPVFNVKNMEFDDKTKQLIEARKDAQLARQNALTAFQNGQAVIAQKKAEQEAIKIEEVTKAEKERDVAVINAEREKSVIGLAAEAKVVAAENEAKEAELKALAIDRMSTAESQANKRKVAAGLTPQERAEWDYKKHVDVMKALADGIARAKYPTVYNAGGDKDGKSGGSLIDFLGYESALNIADRVNKKAK